MPPDDNTTPLPTPLGPPQRKKRASKYAMHVPTDDTRKKVARLTAYDVPQDAIAEFIGTTVRSLQRHYKREIKLGLYDMISAVHGKTYTTATTGTGRAALRAQMYILDRAERRIQRSKAVDANDVRKEMAADTDLVQPRGKMPTVPVL